MHKGLYLTLLLTSLTGCGTVDRVANVGRAPKLTAIDEFATPPGQPSLARQDLDYQQRQQGSGAAAQTQPTSLWRTGSRAFFRDQRATQVGDILTVKINITDNANMANTTTRSRSNKETAGLGNMLGLESQLNKVLPNAVDPAKLVDGSSTSSSSGTGDIQRSENVNLSVAAIVTGLLPNGNLVIRGRQEVRVNFEVRELVVAGIVRPEDITRDNTVQHTQIAEARISYGGRGQLTDVQQARYGQQIYDALFPF